MGKFADFYVVTPAQAGRAARSMGGSKQWPHYAIKHVDMFQLAKLYDLLRSVPGTETWKEFQQDFEADGEDEDLDGGGFMITFLPDSMVVLLAGLNDTGLQEISERWQTDKEFFWRDNAGTAHSVLSELCPLARTASVRGESVILVESGD